MAQKLFEKLFNRQPWGSPRNGPTKKSSSVSWGCSIGHARTHPQNQKTISEFAGGGNLCYRWLWDQSKQWEPPEPSRTICTILYRGWESGRTVHLFGFISRIRYLRSANILLLAFYIPSLWALRNHSPHISATIIKTFITCWWFTVCYPRILVLREDQPTFTNELVLIHWPPSNDLQPLKLLSRLSISFLFPWFLLNWQRWFISQHLKYIIS